jgi:hypothetical protein
MLFASNLGKSSPSRHSRFFYRFSNVADPDSLKPDPDPAFQLNPAPDPDPDPGYRIMIQGFDDQTFKKTVEKTHLFYFDQKFQFTYPWASIKDFTATGEARSPQKRTSST